MCSFKNILQYSYTISSIHLLFHGPSARSVQCPLTSSLSEFPGYWYLLWILLSPMLEFISFPFSFHVSVFSIHSSFIRLFLAVAISAPCHQPFSFPRAWDRHMATVDPEAEYTISYLIE